MKKQKDPFSGSENMKSFFYHSVVIKNIKANSEPLPTLDKLKKEYIVYLLKVTGNNKATTAKILKISLPGLDKKLQRYGIAH